MKKALPICLFTYITLGRTNPYSYKNIKTSMMDHFQVCFVAIGCDGNRTLEPWFWMISNSYTMSDFEQNFCPLPMMHVRCLSILVMQNGR
uniref:Uncharacterized protein n=1 Tax=Lactuca sativa TaxID=4236 RepID=A0A9R1XHJ4_LACSA|nr:hypothetical protein LSAT_V11C500269340 [Lactuca sativa]